MRLRSELTNHIVKVTLIGSQCTPATIQSASDYFINFILGCSERHHKSAKERENYFAVFFFIITKKKPMAFEQGCVDFFMWTIHLPYCNPSVSYIAGASLHLHKGEQWSQSALDSLPRGCPRMAGHGPRRLCPSSGLGPHLADTHLQSQKQEKEHDYSNNSRDEGLFVLK